MKFTGIWKHADEVVELYAAGMSSTKIGSKFEACQRSVLRVLHERGVGVRDSASATRLAAKAAKEIREQVRAELREEHADEIVALYARPWSLNRICLRVGMDYAEVRAVLVGRGVVIRSPGSGRMAYNYRCSVVERRAFVGTGPGGTQALIRYRAQVLGSKTCVVCGAVFYPETLTRRTCSKACRYTLTTRSLVQSRLERDREVRGESCGVSS